MSESAREREVNTPLQDLISRLEFEWETNEEYITRFSDSEQQLILKAVRAVNAHQALVEALKIARECVMESFEYAVANPDDQYLADARLEQIDAALKLAESD